MAKVLSDYKGRIVKTSFELPKELHREFKMACASSGEAIREVLADFVVGYVDSLEGENRWLYTRIAKMRVSIHDLKRFEADVLAGLIDENGRPLTKSKFEEEAAVEEAPAEEKVGDE